MMSDRIDELEAAVARLQASVDGLQDQLVEANDRIRELEDEVENGDEPGSSTETAAEEPLPGVEPAEETEEEVEPDDIIVA